MPGKRLVCFGCFRQFSLREVWFRCANSDVQRLKGCPLELDSKRDEMLRHAFAVRGFWRTFLSWFRWPSRCRCPKCQVISTIRICPHCHRPLEAGRGKLDEHIIAVVGNSRAGKSHYFTVLVEHVIQGAVGQGFRANIGAADDETNKLYNSDYRQHLFVDHHVIPPTTIVRKKHWRLVFRLHLRRGADTKKRIHVFLVFYDFTGQKLVDIAQDASNATRYLWNSSGIIYLANPRDALQFEKYLEGGCLPCPRGVDELYCGIKQELRRNKMWPRPKRLPIPLAICISQFDRFYDQRSAAGLRDELFDPAESPVRNGRIDHKKLDSESAFVRGFMCRASGSAMNLAGQAEEDFSIVRFFAVSALGRRPNGDNQEIADIRPCRVEAPFFWLLSELGVFKGG
jgi:hypothetical protein